MKQAIRPLILIALGMAGCQHQPPKDWRGASETCSVHHCHMDTVEVNGFGGGCILFSPEYYEAREKLFPNGGVQYPPEMSSKERGLIYVCPQCEAAKKAWNAAQ